MIAGYGTQSALCSLLDIVGGGVISLPDDQQILTACEPACNVLHVIMQMLDDKEVEERTVVQKTGSSLKTISMTMARPCVSQQSNEPLFGLPVKQVEGTVILLKPSVPVCRPEHLTAPVDRKLDCQSIWDFLHGLTDFKSLLDERDDGDGKETNEERREEARTVQFMVEKVLESISSRCISTSSGLYKFLRTAKVEVSVPADCMPPFIKQHCDTQLRKNTDRKEENYPRHARGPVISRDFFTWIENSGVSEPEKQLLTLVSLALNGRKQVSIRHSCFPVSMILST